MNKISHAWPIAYQGALQGKGVLYLMILSIYHPRIVPHCMHLFFGLSSFGSKSNVSWNTGHTISDIRIRFHWYSKSRPFNRLKSLNWFDSVQHMRSSRIISISILFRWTLKRLTEARFAIYDCVSLFHIVFRKLVNEWCVSNSFINPLFIKRLAHRNSRQRPLTLCTGVQNADEELTFGVFSFRELLNCCSSNGIL